MPRGRYREFKPICHPQGCNDHRVEAIAQRVAGRRTRCQLEEVEHGTLHEAGIAPSTAP
jgi:hypothetical protein